MKKGLLVIVSALLMVLTVLSGCKAPANFEVTSLEVMPLEVIAGEAVDVTAEVENTGASEGTYTAVLMVDGVEVERKDIVIEAGATGTVTFSLAKDTPGSYQIGVGGLSSTLVVVEEVELKYDDGTSDGSCSAGGWGFLVHFLPPAIPFTINEVNLFTDLRGSGYEEQVTKVEIRDRNFNVVYSVFKPAAEFSSEVGWVTIDIPQITVTDEFYVVFYTDSRAYGGVYIHYDSGVVNEHSEMVLGGEVTDWIWEQIPKETANWMIRVIGTAIMPES